jgi:hypothetical protein
VALAQIGSSLRTGVAGLAAALGVWHGAHAVKSWLDSRQWQVSDPSLSDFWFTRFEVETVVALACAGAAAILWRSRLRV